MRKSIFRKPAWLITAGWVILGLLLAPGCGQVAEPTGIDIPETPSPDVLPSATATLVSTAAPTATQEITLTPTTTPIERPRYNITANYDPVNQRVIVEERIVLSNPAGKDLDGIDLVVPPNNWRGVFSLQDINAADLPLEGYSLEGVRLHLKFENDGWKSDENLNLFILYTLDLPQQNDRPGYGPSPFGYTSLQTNLVDWYPMVPPYSEESGWLIHDPWIFGEYLVYPVADFEVSLGFESPGLIVAASTAPLAEGNPLKYSLKSARNFVFSMSSSYQVLVESVGDVQVYGYIFPAFQVPGRAAFEATLEALDLYQDLFGPYQQSSLSMVQADFDHGMEYDGLYFLSNAFYNIYNGTEKSYLVAIAVHETAHQWWFGQVANDQALEPWLDEALCTFSELVYYESLYPESVEWWWNTRVDWYQPEGRIDRSIYGFREYVDQYLNYRNATYLQGAKFIAALKEHMGEEPFYLFLKEYRARNEDLIVTKDDFFGLLGEYLDLSDLIWLEDYFPND
jgi:hypothetical protein